jgi:hypothetical protein
MIILCYSSITSDEIDVILAREMSIHSNNKISDEMSSQVQCSRHFKNLCPEQQIIAISYFKSHQVFA